MAEEPADEEGRAVEGEVVPPLEDAPPQPAGPRTFFHPLSGAVILFADWAAFGLEWATGFTLTAAACAGAFALTYFAVSWIQKNLGGDTPKAAAGKALIGALAAGVPFPITGTAVGALIIALSGLPRPGKR